MEKLGIAERVALYVREFHPGVFDEALDAIAKEDLEDFKKQKNK